MRFSTVTVAALAAGAIASPIGETVNNERRDITITIGGRHPTTIVIPWGRGTKATSTPVDAAGKKPKTTSSSVQATPSPKALSSSTSVAAAPKTSSNAANPQVPTTSTKAVVQSSTKAAAQTSSKAPASTPSTPASNQDPPQSYINVALRHHNVHRANHSASDLTWSQDLANTAKKIGAKCVWAHDVQMDGGGYGQNLAAGPKADALGVSITELWYNNEMPSFAPYYGQAQPGGDNFNNVFEEFGHFTQVVWKGSSQVGCYTYDCTSKGGISGLGSNVPPYLTVCNYKDPGNYVHEFDTGVGRPLGKPTVSGSY